MKKTGILNRDISAIVAAMGHYDRLIVCDAGFPVPKGMPCVDVSLEGNVPDVLTVLKIVAKELVAEQFYFAEEILANRPNRMQEVQEIFPNAAGSAIPHAEFRPMAWESRAYIRTGDFFPYANVMLVSGVAY